MLPRAPKKSSYILKTSQHQLTNVEKGMIVAFFYCYGTFSMVTQLVGWLGSTIKSFLQRACERGHVNNLPRSGRREIPSRQTKRQILQAARGNQAMTWNELWNYYILEVYFSIIDRLLRDHNIRKWIATEGVNWRRNTLKSDWHGQWYGRSGQLRILKALYGAMNVVWRNSVIHARCGCFVHQQKNDLKNIFDLQQSPETFSDYLGLFLGAE